MTFSNQWTYLVDECLFRGPQVQEILNSITKAVKEIMRDRGYAAIICYLDDFLIIYIACTFSEYIQALS